MTTKEHCLHELDKLMTDLRAQGTDTVPIVLALGDICLKAARSEPERHEEYLNSLIAIFDTEIKAAKAEKI
ncbi:MAG: hypothetical protein AAF564_25430 [Bacteroidota bacterium]